MRLQLQRSGYKVFALRGILIVTLLFIYNELPWDFLVQSLSSSLDSIFSFFGNSSVQYMMNNDHILQVNGIPFIITANCTYLDVALVAAPLCWRIQKGILMNLFRMVILMSLIQLLSLLRIWVAIHFYLAGASWEYLHDVPYVVLYIIIVATCSILALQVDLGFRVKDVFRKPNFDYS